MSRSGREAPQDVREWSGVPPKCPGVVGRPSRMSGSVREAFPDVQVWMGGPPGCPGVFRSPTKMFGSEREALPDVWEWSRGLPGYLGGSPKYLGVVRRPSSIYIREWSGIPPDGQ